MAVLVLVGVPVLVGVAVLVLVGVPVLVAVGATSVGVGIGLLIPRLSGSNDAFVLSH